MGFLDKLLGRKPKDLGISVYSPLNGELLELAKVPDPTFGSGMLGQGCAVLPSDGKVYAPFDGTVNVIPGMEHAVNIISNDGVELLIHVGLETVSLKGEPFTVYKKDGEQVKKGDLLLEADLEKIKAANLQTITPIVVCNTDNFQKVELSRPCGNVIATEQVLKITK